MNQLDAYELFQLSRYGNILPAIEYVSDDELFESDIEEFKRMADFINKYEELELLEKEY